MFKEYGENTQKGCVIRSMLRMGSKNYYEDFEIENYKGIFNSNNVGARLSQLLKDGILDVEYFENPAINPLTKCHCYHRARYRLKPEAVIFYKELYLIEEIERVKEAINKERKKLFGIF